MGGFQCQLSDPNYDSVGGGRPHRCSRPRMYVTGDDADALMVSGNLPLRFAVFAPRDLLNCSPAVKSFWASMPAKSVFLSVITIGEITKGVALLPDGEKKRLIRAWSLGLSSQFEDRILPVDQDAAEIWGELSAAGQKSGVSIPVSDGLIAATALRHGLHVATRNTPHFEAAGAMIVNPWLSPGASVTHVCFLRETGGGYPNSTSLGETDNLENLNLPPCQPRDCYLHLNQA